MNRTSSAGGVAIEIDPPDRFRVVVISRRPAGARGLWGFGFRGCYSRLISQVPPGLPEGATGSRADAKSNFQLLPHSIALAKDKSPAISRARPSLNGKNLWQVLQAVFTNWSESLRDEEGNCSGEKINPVTIQALEGSRKPEIQKGSSVRRSPLSWLPGFLASCFIISTRQRGTNS